MAIVNTGGIATDIGGGGVHSPQRRGGQELATKIGKGSIYLRRVMAADGSEVSTTEVRESNHKGGM